MHLKTSAVSHDDMGTLPASVALCAGKTPATSEFPSQRANDTEFICCQPEQAVDQTAELPVI